MQTLTSPIFLWMQTGEIYHIHANIQGDSGLVDIIAEDDFRGIYDQESEYQYGSFSQILKSYGCF
jgi:hypothetical protein